VTRADQRDRAICSRPSTEGREQDGGLRNAKELCSRGIGPVKRELARGDADLVTLCVREDAEGHARYLLGGLGDPATELLGLL
jgi:hypothetical protein